MSTSALIRLNNYSVAVNAVSVLFCIVCNVYVTNY